MIDNKEVVVYKQELPAYSSRAPFDPPQSYPEYAFQTECDPANHVYRSIRDALYLCGFDTHNFGKPQWNPLKHIVNPGETVLVKPNMIAHSHKYNDTWEHVITHGSVLRAVLDYVFLALQGCGKIIIADAPQTDSNIDLIKTRLGIERIQELYWNQRKFEIDFLDLRDELWIEKDGINIDKVKLKGDPVGNVSINLAEQSFFADQDTLNKRYYGAFYDIEETNQHHSNGVHEYMISRTALESDVFISLPKLKTHKKVGLTLNLKGLVGINGNKNWLPHYAIGSADDNGDQFPSQTISRKIENTLVLKAKRVLLHGNPLATFAARKLKRFGYTLLGDTEDVIRSGNWYGNDTCWRMTLDLNRILLYGRTDGTLGEGMKRYFSVVDGIVGMEGNGPVAGRPKPAGFIIMGGNALATDMVCTKIMGFDYRKIRMLYRAFDHNRYPLCRFQPEEIYVISNNKELQGKLTELSSDYVRTWQPHFGWKGQVEL